MKISQYTECLYVRKNADIYDNYRAHDWLERQHILSARKRIRAIRKLESKRQLELNRQKAEENSQSREHVPNQ